MIINYDNLDSQSEWIYPTGTTNWAVVHSKKPTLPEDKRHRSPENLSKTKVLYPNIYQCTKDTDICNQYGKEPGNQTENIKSGKFDE